MAKRSKYRIILSELSQARQRYEYDLDGSFFTEMDARSDVSSADIHVVVDAWKSLVAYELQLTFTGDIDVPCDRCLDDIQIKLDNAVHLYVKPSEDGDSEREEVVLIPHEAREIDLAWLLYESAMLQVPLKRAHDEDECNPQMLSHLEQYRCSSEQEDDSF